MADTHQSTTTGTGTPGTASGGTPGAEPEDLRAPLSPSDGEDLRPWPPAEDAFEDEEVEPDADDLAALAQEAPVSESSIDFDYRLEEALHADTDTQPSVRGPVPTKDLYAEALANRSAQNPQHSLWAPKIRYELNPLAPHAHEWEVQCPIPRVHTSRKGRQQYDGLDYVEESWHPSESLARLTGILAWQTAHANAQGEPRTDVPIFQPTRIQFTYDPNDEPQRLLAHRLDTLPDLDIAGRIVFVYHDDRVTLPQPNAPRATPDRPDYTVDIDRQHWDPTDILQEVDLDARSTLSKDPLHRTRDPGVRAISAYDHGHVYSTPAVAAPVITWQELPIRAWPESAQGAWKPGRMALNHESVRVFYRDDAEGIQYLQDPRRNDGYPWVLDDRGPLDAQWFEAHGLTIMAEDLSAEAIPNVPEPIAEHITHQITTIRGAHFPNTVRGEWAMVEVPSPTKRYAFCRPSPAVGEAPEWLEDPEKPGHPPLTLTEAELEWKDTAQWLKRAGIHIVATVDDLLPLTQYDRDPPEGLPSEPPSDLDHSASPTGVPQWVDAQQTPPRWMRPVIADYQRHLRETTAVAKTRVLDPAYAPIRGLYPKAEMALQRLQRQSQAELEAEIANSAKDPDTYDPLRAEARAWFATRVPVTTPEGQPSSTWVLWHGEDSHPTLDPQTIRVLDYVRDGKTREVKTFPDVLGVKQYAETAGVTVTTFQSHAVLQHFRAEPLVHPHIPKDTRWITFPLANNQYLVGHYDPMTDRFAFHQRFVAEAPTPEAPPSPPVRHQWLLVQPTRAERWVAARLVTHPDEGEGLAQVECLMDPTTDRPRVFTPPDLTQKALQQFTAAHPTETFSPTRYDFDQAWPEPWKAAMQHFLVMEKKRTPHPAATAPSTPLVGEGSTTAAPSVPKAGKSGPPNELGDLLRDFLAEENTREPSLGEATKPLSMDSSEAAIDSTKHYEPWLLPSHFVHASKTFQGWARAEGLPPTIQRYDDVARMPREMGQAVRRTLQQSTVGLADFIPEGLPPLSEAVKAPPPESTAPTEWVLVRPTPAPRWIAVHAEPASAETPEAPPSLHVLRDRTTAKPRVFTSADLTKYHCDRFDVTDPDHPLPPHWKGAIARLLQAEAKLQVQPDALNPPAEGPMTLIRPTRSERWLMARPIPSTTAGASDPVALDFLIDPTTHKPRVFTTDDIRAATNVRYDINDPDHPIPPTWKPALVAMLKQAGGATPPTPKPQPSPPPRRTVPPKAPTPQISLDEVFGKLGRV